MQIAIMMLQRRAKQCQKLARDLLSFILSSGACNDQKSPSRQARCQDGSRDGRRKARDPSSDFSDNSIACFTPVQVVHLLQITNSDKEQNGPPRCTCLKRR